jgi:serine/threonine protein kinase/Flp pilus assembly protein TadD
MGRLLSLHALTLAQPSMDEEPTLPLDAAQAKRPEAPPIASAWGGFTLHARVGFGGFGEVYRAWDPHLQREVALKLLLPGAASGQADYDSMLAEARALASVRHPNIVPVYGIDRHDGRVGFWTDFVRGKTLAELLRVQGRFGFHEAALIGLDVTRALSAVHRAGILHRDIKAENVMREEGGRILLMDFGLSGLQQAQTNIAGTPNYMAPEIFRGGQATVATDIYAAGVLLYYLVAGDYPARLSGLSALESLARLAKRRPLMDLRPDVPEALLRTIGAAMELDPAKRYASAGELAAALADSLGVSPPPETISISIPQDLKARKRVGMLAIVAVVSGLTAAFFAWPGSVQRVSHWFGKPASAPSANTYDQYQKAQDLLLHSYKNANIANAVKGFQAVLQADPTFALAEARLGAAYFLQYRNSHDPKLLDMAKDATNRAIDLDPNLAPPYITLSRMAAMQAQTPLAMQLAHKALDLDPRSPEAFGALADVYEAEGKTGDAVNSLQKAIDLAPDDWRWPVRLGIDLYGAGDFKQSIAQFQRGVDLAPDNAIAFYDLGVANIASGEMDEARKDLERSLSIDPDADTYATLGNALALLGRFDDAEAMEKKSIALNPGSYHAWSNLGIAYQWDGNHRQEAAQAFRNSIKLAEAARAKSSHDTDILVTLAKNYASVGNSGQSVILIRQALAMAPDNPAVQYQAGAAYEILGRRGDAIPLIAQALSHGYGANDFQHDPELAALRADPAFASALASENARKK